ncbi:MAG: 2-amino-4-hydroxy-6-hydroxymethyldihydropteridine diphosphokinase [Planctomycetota bacterium]
MKPNKAIIAVGSNIEPKTHIERAREMIAAEHTLVAVSNLVRTTPQGLAEQADFLNGAFSIETGLDSERLEAYLKEVEATLGRVRTENKNGPRTIDLDITVFNGEIIDNDFYRYDFVRKAVTELMPEIDNNLTGNIDADVIEEHFRIIMEKGLGLDLTDPNFVDTPARVARSYREIFEGLETANDKIHEILGQSFPTKYDGIVQETGITVFSMCPHHFLPIRYEVSIGYVPDEKALGLSKLARIVELVAKLPSLQETFTERIVDEIDDHIKPRGVICVVKGAHYCMQMRGVKQKDTWTTTSSARGVFLEKEEMELKFYNLLQNA